VIPLAHRYRGTRAAGLEQDPPISEYLVFGRPPVRCAMIVTYAWSVGGFAAMKVTWPVRDPVTGSATVVLDVVSQEGDAKTGEAARGAEDRLALRSWRCSNETWPR
jgi:hypothetical protein